MPFARNRAPFALHRESPAPARDPFALAGAPSARDREPIFSHQDATDSLHGTVDSVLETTDPVQDPTGSPDDATDPRQRVIKRQGGRSDSARNPILRHRGAIYSPQAEPITPRPLFGANKYQPPRCSFQVAFKLSVIRRAAHAAGYHLAPRVSAGTGFQDEFYSELTWNQKPRFWRAALSSCMKAWASVGEGR